MRCVDDEIHQQWNSLSVSCKQEARCVVGFNDNSACNKSEGRVSAHFVVCDFFLFARGLPLGSDMRRHIDGAKKTLRQISFSGQVSLVESRQEVDRTLRPHGTYSVTEGSSKGIQRQVVQGKVSETHRC